MEDNWLWYLAGSFDTSGTITVMVRKNSQRALEYSVSPKVKFSRPESVESLFGLVSEYAEDEGIQYRIDELESSNRVMIQNPESIRRFLEPLLGGMIQQRERAEFMLEEVLPAFEDGTPDDEEEFLERVELADELREYPIKARRQTNYDAEFFREEWDLE